MRAHIHFCMVLILDGNSETGADGNSETGADGNSETGAHLRSDLVL